MVKIHGNWCGPNWTAGRNVSARDYRLAGGTFKSKCIDRLDCACRAHDKACSGKSGCSASADRKLASSASLISLTSINSQIRAKARLIAGGMLAASLTR